MPEPASRPKTQRRPFPDILRELWDRGEEQGLERPVIASMLEDLISERVKQLQKYDIAGPVSSVETVVGECRKACVPVTAERVRQLVAAISREEHGALLKAKFGGGDPETGIRAFEARAARTAVSSPFRTGIERLDAAMGGGIDPGEILHIVGHEGGGKTALMISVLESALWSTESRILVLELDLPKGSVEQLRLARLMGISPREVARTAAEGSRDYAESKRILASLGGPDRLAIYEGPRTLKDLEIILRYEVPSLVLLDYVSAVDGDMGGAPFRDDLSLARTVTRQVRRWRDDWGIAFVLLSQTSRASKREMRQGLVGGHGLGSGDLERLADIELELYCDEPAEPDGPVRRIATVTKTRKAAAGRSFELEFEGKTRTFTRRAREVIREKTREPVFRTGTNPF
jgi:KaiC/GvpD/RAD55 family RecA-like ATPase